MKGKIIAVLVKLGNGLESCCIMPILKSEVGDIEEIQKRAKFVRQKARQERVEKIKNGKENNKV